MAKRRSNHYRLKRFAAGFFYLVVLIAVIAGLFYVIRDNRQKKAERVAQKEALANAEGDLQGTMSIKLGTEEEAEVTTTPTATPIPTPAEEPEDVLGAEVSPDVETAEAGEPTVTPEVSPIVTPVGGVDNKNVSIMVLNGTGVVGVASYWRTQLQEAGYTDVSMANYSGEVTATTVIYGTEANATGLRTHFPNANFRDGTITSGIQNPNSKVYEFYIVIGTDDARNS